MLCYLILYQQMFCTRRHISERTLEVSYKGGKKRFNVNIVISSIKTFENQQMTILTRRCLVLLEN